MSTDESDASVPRVADGDKTPVILQVLPALDTGGVERGTVDIAAAVHDAGWRSIVVSNGGPMVREVLRGGAAHIELPVHTKNLLAMRRNVSRLVKVIREHEVDIVHVRSRAPAWSVAAACRQTGAAMVTTFHGTYTTNLPGKKIYNAVMTRGARVIAISEFIRDHILSTYDVDEARVRIIHRGIDLERFSPSAVSQERVIKLAKQWRLPDGMPVILLPGRVTRWKGQLLLVKALASMARDDLRCLMVGSDQGRSGFVREIESTVRRLGLDSVVHVVGGCDDMPAAYMLSDVVVSASTDAEAFGRVVAEGQAMGRPVVAPAHGAAPEIVIPDATGWLFEPGNAEDLARNLEIALALGNDDRDALAQAAIANVRRHFAKERMTEETLALYREVMAEAAAESGNPIAA